MTGSIELCTLVVSQAINNMTRRLKHVIFLGAGASCTSGYPIGQELRLLMTSRDYLQRKLKDIYPTNQPISTDPVYSIISKCLEHFDRFSQPVEFFRHGAFATVDEFSNLASGSYPEHVKAMKKLLSFILALHNPEINFDKSDYYPFIQRLFRANALSMFRNEIAIITFNYDCYLDYLMRQAYRHRLAVQNVPVVIKNHPDVLKGPQPLTEPWSSKLSSGFFSQGGDKSLAWRTDQFNYYKLHGSIAYTGMSASLSYDSFFSHGMSKRFDFLDKKWYLDHYIPPIVFPWELFDVKSGQFISEDEFNFVKTNDETSRRDGKSLFNHFKTMWENAKLSVEQADKISFVGLSMHEYLENGFRYLFQDFGKSKDAKTQADIGNETINTEPKYVEVVVANPENTEFQNSKNRLHPASLCGKVADLLTKVAPNMRFIRSSSENDGILRSMESSERPDDPNITPRLTFKEFIEREMD